MINEIQKYYPAFYNMLIVTTLLSNQGNDEYDNDCKKVIDFIGHSYEMSDELLDYCKKIILDELVAISTNEDVSAFVNSHTIDSKPEEIDSLLSMKCDAIGVVETLKNIKNVNMSPSWFDYSHYRPYYPVVRYRQLAVAATTGNPIANKVVGILSFLNIGCDDKELNIKSAIYRLKQCMIWGDVTSIYFLKFIYSEIKDLKNKKICDDLLKLVPYINEGRTVLPKSFEENICEDAKHLFSYITSIKQDIVINEGRLFINYSFVEAILSDEINHYAKLGYINNYRDQKWKDVTNSSFDPSKKIGFKVGK